MTPFNAPLEDILFSLVHVAEARRVGEWDREAAADIMEHFALFAERVIAPLNTVGDAQGARLENGHVRMPPGFRDAYRQLAEGGWQGLTAPEEYGGMAMPALDAAAVSEIFSGANHSLQMVCNLVPGAISTLLRFGSKAQQDKWIPRLARGEVLSTMCLTEPGAGSDLSAIRTSAVLTEVGWRINGEKIFISGGDQDLSEDILHLVLARTSDNGTRGLSLYVCAKQPGAKVIRLEEKMGLHASPTCQMIFEAAEAELIGDQGDGLAAMFTLMNHARLDVALQGVAHAARAAQIAKNFASGRKQGRKSDGSPACLTDHADVMRMLEEQDILAMTARAMCHVTLAEMQQGIDPALAEFLTSLCKVYGSEAGPRAADLGMQIMGGYGYLTEYGMEQIWRDARICAIYEGANGIHTRGLATRGTRPGGGADAFENLMIRLSAGVLDPIRLETWQDMKLRLQRSQDPSPMAQEFYRASASLFQNAIWQKFRFVAEKHSQTALIHSLANRALTEPV